MGDAWVATVVDAGGEVGMSDCEGGKDDLGRFLGRLMDLTAEEEHGVDDGLLWVEGEVVREEEAQVERLGGGDRSAGESEALGCGVEQGHACAEDGG